MDFLITIASIEVMIVYSIILGAALSGASAKETWLAVIESNTLRIFLSAPLAALIVWSLARPIGFMPGYLFGIVCLLVLWTRREAIS